MRYIIFFIIISSIIYAHPPTGINFDYNLETKQVYISIEHSVKSLKDHYIDYIEMYNNNNLIIRQSSTEQYSNSIQLYSYIIPELKVNDKIKIFARCNKFGDLKREFIISLKTNNR